MPSAARRESCIVAATTGRPGIRLEPEFREALDDICARESIDYSELICRAQKTAPKAPRTRAVRAFILEYFRNHERAAAHRAALYRIRTLGSANGGNAPA